MILHWKNVYKLSPTYAQNALCANPQSQGSQGNVVHTYTGLGTPNNLSLYIPVSKHQTIYHCLPLLIVDAFHDYLSRCKVQYDRPQVNSIIFMLISHYIYYKKSIQHYLPLTFATSFVLVMHYYFSQLQMRTWMPHCIPYITNHNVT